MRIDDVKDKLKEQTYKISIDPTKKQFIGCALDEGMPEEVIDRDEGEHNRVYDWQTRDV